jgi:anti-sigma B factor antagonist
VAIEGDRPAPPFGIKHSRERDATTIVVEGELDLVTSERLRHEVDLRLDERPARLHIDLNDVSFIDSMGIKCLLNAATRGTRRDVDVSFSYGQPVGRIVEALGLRDRLPRSA